MQSNTTNNINYLKKSSFQELVNKNTSPFFSQFYINEAFKNCFIDSNEVCSFDEGLINNKKFINRHFAQINQNLEINEQFLSVFETYTARKNRLVLAKIPILKYIFLFLDFIWNRFFPKIKYLNSIYFLINKRRNRVLSKAEVLGRLVCCGFEIVKVENINHYCYFKAKKIKEFDKNAKSSYGLIFKMKRLGKNGKLFNVYKFRTMHPYSEYLQDYMLKEFGFAPNGKVENDFRLTPWGKFLRKYWIDELPQLFNVLKGDMKLVGLRPVSASYFKQLPADFAKERIKFKPGCIPPYVSLNYNSSVKHVLEAEKIYLNDKQKNAYFTDLKYFFYALVNIIFKGKRSA